MLARSGFHIALIPPDKIEPDVVNGIAQTLKKDIYQVRHLISGKLPRLIAHYNSLEEAGAAVEALKLLGILVYLCDDAVVRRPPPRCFSPDRLEAVSGGINFINQGSSVKYYGNDIFLMIKGNKPCIKEIENTVTSRKLSVGKTLITGGIPIFNKVVQKTRERTTEIEPVLRLYSRDSIDPVVEIKQHGMDYKFLGSKFNYSSLVNFSMTIDELRTTFPGAHFDERLVRLQTREEDTTENEFELDCRLLWLYYKKINDDTNKVKEQTS